MKTFGERAYRTESPARPDADQTLARLNAYQGENIWQDIIYDLLTSEEWDAAPDTSDRFIHNGVEYRHNEGRWTEHIGRQLIEYLAEQASSDGEYFDLLELIR